MTINIKNREGLTALADSFSGMFSPNNKSSFWTGFKNEIQKGSHIKAAYLAAKETMEKTMADDDEENDPIGSFHDTLLSGNTLVYVSHSGKVYSIREWYTGSIGGKSWEITLPDDSCIRERFEEKLALLK